MHGDNEKETERPQQPTSGHDRPNEEGRGDEVARDEQRRHRTDPGEGDGDEASSR